MGDEITELSSENNIIKFKLGECDGKWLEETRGKQLRRINGEERANFFMRVMKKHLAKI